MLVLARKLHESIRVGDEVRIIIVEIRPGRVRLGIEAPPHVRIRREENYPSEMEVDCQSAPVLAASSAFLRTPATTQPMICGNSPLKTGRLTHRTLARDSVD